DLGFSVPPCLGGYFFTTEAQRPQRVSWVGCGGAQISFRVFRVGRGLIPSAVAGPGVAAVLWGVARVVRLRMRVRSRAPRPEDATSSGIPTSVVPSYEIGIR